MKKVDSKLFFESAYPYAEFFQLLPEFIKQVQANQVTGKSNGKKMHYFSSGLPLQTRYGQGAASKAPYINWHVVNIYYDIHEARLKVGIQDSQERVILGGQASNINALIDGSAREFITGKGWCYVYYSTSAILDDIHDIEELYGAFIDLCCKVDALGVDDELWSSTWFSTYTSDMRARTGLDRPPTSDEIKFERRRMLGSARIAILERDGYRCKECGRDLKDIPSQAHIDHEIPVSKGGKTIPSNLRTLCQSCNLKKSNKMPGATY